MTEPIIIPSRITRAFIRTHPEYTFLYSSTVHKEVPHGQASECMGEENVQRVPVRWSLCKSSGYFNDNALRDISVELRVAISLAEDDYNIGKIIIPFPKMGQGASRMMEFAPRAFDLMNRLVDKIKYQNIVYQ